MSPLRSRPYRLLLLVLLCLPPATLAYSSGSGTCDAWANGSPNRSEGDEFMAWKTHHPGDDGGFLIEFSQPAYVPGAALTVSLRHATDQLFGGLLLYAQTAGGERLGLFTPSAAITAIGNLPAACSFAGHTVTHAEPQTHATLALEWTAPAAAEQPLMFRALILRVDAMSGVGTDFYEVGATLAGPDLSVFSDGFEDPL